MLRDSLLERFDLVRFVKEVHEAGLFVHLRIGPYACAEWNYGGFPVWLHFIPGIQFRTTNSLFKREMERFLAKIVNLMKDENLFASQGGPIILAQVENEYGNVEWAYGVAGELYVKWAAETAVGLNTTVPWVMCAQEDAPDPIINTCNGFYCDRFSPNSPFKPKMWTENYVGWFLAFGYAVPFRPVEDLAFAVARFFETGGTFQNYYMYFGGTNFGRTAGGPLVATSYDYDAPINEYGFINQPKWGHLRDLHIAIEQCEEHLVNANATQISLGKNLEAHVYYRSPKDCAAFLANYGSSTDATVNFRGILTCFLHGIGYGNHDDASFTLSAKVKLHTGSNTVDVLSVMIGLQNYGPWFDVQGAGLYSVILTDLTDSEEDLSFMQWTYQVGLEGEFLGLENASPANSSIWTKGSATPVNQSLIWYKTVFLPPEGKGPISLNLSGMGKGQAWVNGQSIGRYWSSYLSPSSGCSEDCDYRGTYDASKCLKKCGQPAQTLYHVPRSWLQPGENLLVIHEELGGDPSTISVVTQNAQLICGRVSEGDLPPADTWEPGVGFASRTPLLRLSCETGWHVASVRFASFGTPEGNCGALSPGSCHADVSSIVHKDCIGKQACSILVSTDKLGDPCPNVLKSLAVEALCRG
ncbi:UNVERIFIED_CONTAM: Beta-galactosidase 8 [Sesamum radiatum]|uniref:Beta-galactosidase n=1 Tax=Sesamum radiatum TaxID=300843 RepID=A0AAW2KGH2_SESRA